MQTSSGKSLSCTSKPSQNCESPTSHLTPYLGVRAADAAAPSAPYFLPSLEIIWAVLTFCQSRVKNTTHVYVIRALIGFFEAPSFGGTHLIREYRGR
jgi:hypothetical protein